MPREVTVTLSHDLGVAEARKRFEDGFGKVKNAMSGGMMLSFTEEWTKEDQLTFRAKGLGQNIFGVIDIFPAHVRIVATLPNLLASLAETISGRMEKQGQILLEKK